jgi:ribosome-binding factor A
MDTNRLKKIEGQFQKDLAEIFRELAQSRFRGLLLTITRVAITTDLSLARCHISVFPATNKDEIINWLNEQKNVIKNDLVHKLKGSLRKMPDLVFYLDDSIDREETIDRILKGGGESPIK